LARAAARLWSRSASVRRPRTGACTEGRVGAGGGTGGRASSRRGSRRGRLRGGSSPPLPSLWRRRRESCGCGGGRRPNDIASPPPGSAVIPRRSAGALWVACRALTISVQSLSASPRAGAGFGGGAIAWYTTSSSLGSGASAIFAADGVYSQCAGLFASSLRASGRERVQCFCLLVSYSR